MDKLLDEIYGLSDDEMQECSRHLMLGGGTRGLPTIKRGRGVRVYANNSLAPVAAIKQINMMRDSVLKNTREMGSYLRGGLEELQKEYLEIGDSFVKIPYHNWSLRYINFSISACPLRVASLLL